MQPTVDDAEVLENAPGSNYGSLLYMRITSSKENSMNRRIFLKFDLSQGVPAGYVIEEARLYLWCWSIFGARGKNVQVYGVGDDSWSERTITWGNQPMLAPENLLDTVAVTKENEWYCWNITSFVQAQRNLDNIVSLCLKAEVENLEDPDNFSYAFDAKEWGTIAEHPYLAIGARVSASIASHPVWTTWDALMGGKATLPLRVTNRGAFVDNYTLAVSTENGWSYELGDIALNNVQPGETKSTTITVTVPWTAGQYWTDRITVTATSAKDSKMTDVGVGLARANTRLWPVGDSQVVENFPDRNYGSVTYSYVGSSTTEWKNERVFLKFDVGKLIPAGYEIKGAKLYVNCFRISGAAGKNVQVYAVEDDSWTEATITWNNQPALGSPLGTVAITEEDKWYSWDVTSFVVQQRGVDNIVSLCLRAETENLAEPENFSYGFSSREAGAYVR
ncbi:MAG: DNRLRE domain-containing protein, partial [Hadesarchaea archaeon]|nr:DNRLRE domain-containing protein [Hadesarchaea archaeon]